MRSRRLLEIRERVLEALRGLAGQLNARVYLFGSYARGVYAVESDVDIVVVSEAFRGLDYVSRVELVRIRLPEDMGFDIIALTPEELEERRERAFFKEVTGYWIEVA